MKVLSAQQIRQLDSHTIVNEPISSVDLMKRAGRAVYTRLRKLIPEGSSILILCGTGNNGGDGLVISREYERDRIPVTTKVFALGEMSPDCEAVAKETSWDYIKSFDELRPHLEASIYIIDCLLGSGQNRPLKGELAALVEGLNQTPHPVIAVDIPTGLITDGQNEEALILHARHTLSLQLPKLGFFLPPHSKSTQSFEMVNIGLDQGFINTIPSPFHFLLSETVKPLLRRRDTFSHKGDYGHIMLMAGSDSMSGAAILAAKAALRSGCGKITVVSTNSVIEAVRHQLPESMSALRSEISEESLSGKTITVGPGLGRGQEALAFLTTVLRSVKEPCVLDADALYLLGKNPELLSELPSNSLLTPHPGEFKFLTGEEFQGRNGLEVARAFAQEHSIYLLVKGAYSALCSPDGSVIFNSTGNPSMAKGGSGDVLTGMIGAFLAQGYLPLAAGQIGMYLHGLAGDIARRKHSEISVLASDIIENIGLAYRELTQGSEEKD